MRTAPTNAAIIRWLSSDKLLKLQFIFDNSNGLNYKLGTDIYFIASISVNRILFIDYNCGYITIFQYSLHYPYLHFIRIFVNYFPIFIRSHNAQIIKNHTKVTELLYLFLLFIILYMSKSSLNHFYSIVFSPLIADWSLLIL